MIGLILSALAGFLISWFFRVSLLVAASVALFVLNGWYIVLKRDIVLEDILLLFAYLAALQGGFLLGAFAKRGRAGGCGL